MHDDDTEEAARFLRATRPEPDPHFVAETERRLLGRAPRTRARRPLVAAFGLTGAAAAVMLVASLAGSGPISINGQDDVRARDNCRTVQTTTDQREGKLIERADGTTTVVTTSRPVTRSEERCR